MRPAATALVVALVFAACGGGGGSTEASPPQAPDRPNVIVIMTDDQTLDSMAVMEQTLSLLGDQGTTFTQAFVSNSVCCPSRATFLTGQYTHNNGVEYNSPDPGVDPPNGGPAGLVDETALPVWLERAGYETTFIGKYLNGYGSGVDGSLPSDIPAGWTRWHGLLAPESYSYHDFWFNHDGEFVCYGAPPDADPCDRTLPSIYLTDLMAQLAVDAIRDAPDDRPFFVSVNPTSPHVATKTMQPMAADRHRGSLADLVFPAGPAFNEEDVSDKPSPIRRLPPLSDLSQGLTIEGWQKGLESLLAVDELVAAVISALDERGVLDDTVVIFTSDNGLTLGAHRIAPGKYYFYEPSIRVPLLIRGGDFPAGHRADQLVVNTDLAATIASLAGVEPLLPQDGLDLLPLALDQTAAADRTLLLETGRSQRAFDRYGFWAQGVRMTSHAYWELETQGGLEYELYDLETDPDQLDNLAGRPEAAAIQAEADARLDRLRDCVGDACSGLP